MMYQIAISERTLHFLQPAGTSRGVYTTRKSYYIALSADDQPGVVGMGECATLPDLSCDALSDRMPDGRTRYEQVLRQVCDDFCRTGCIDYERLRPYPSILFGLETALMRFGTPPDTPFARGEEGIPINGLVWMGTFDEMYRRIEEKLRLGFRCVKLKIGAIDWQQEMELIRFVRQHFSQEQIELRVDANGAFAPEEALHRLEQLAPYGIHSIEQPIRQGQWQQMAALCERSPLPIALDEELIGINDFAAKKALLDTIRPHYIILKPSLHGGMHGCREWIELARQRGIGSWMTSALESNVGLNAIAHFAAEVYGPHITMPQGLGTGQLFTDNIPMPLEIRGDQLWCVCR